MKSFWKFQVRDLNIDSRIKFFSVTRSYLQRGLLGFYSACASTFLVFTIQYNGALEKVISSAAPVMIISITTLIFILAIHTTNYEIEKLYRLKKRYKAFA